MKEEVKENEEQVKEKYDKRLGKYNSKDEGIIQKNVMKEEVKKTKGRLRESLIKDQVNTNRKMKE